MLAGSAAFLTALQDALTRRLGTPPRAAESPHLAFALCQDDARLLVFEYGGQEWLATCEDLRQVVGDGLGMVAVVPPRHAAAHGALLGAGVDEVVAWDGRAEPVLEAVARILAPAAEAAPAVPAPRPGPALTAAPRPAPRAAPPPPPAPRGVPAQRPPPASRAAPALTPPPAPRADPDLTPPPAPIASPAMPPPGLPQPDDEPNFSIVEAPPPDIAAQWGNAELIAFERSWTWPGTVIKAADAEGVLAGALSGFWPELEETRAQAERAIATLSDLERKALLFVAVPFASAPLCRAAGLRFQVLQALATAPAVEGPVDGAAVRAILAEIDAVLAELKRLEGEAPPDAQGAIGGIRRALVKEAIDFTEAAHRSSPSAAPAAAPPLARSAPVARILSNKAVGRPEIAVAPAPSERGKWIAFAVVLLLGGAYHGWRFATRPRPLSLQAVPGAPPGMIATPEGPGGARVLVSETGAPPDPEKVAQFKMQEEMKGGAVQETGPGLLLMLPRSAARHGVTSQPAGGSP